MGLENKKVRLGDYPFLEGLTSEGAAYQGYDLDHEITVVAVEGNADDWAAYFSTPWHSANVGNPAFMVTSTAMYGVKLPYEVAADLFPEWAKKFKWRP